MSFRRRLRESPRTPRRFWMAAFNSAFEEYKGDEEKCAATAWAAVKNKYKKVGEEWISIELHL